MHGVAMVFFVLIPAVPGDPRQLRAAADDRRQGRRLPEDQPAQLVHLRHRVRLHACARWSSAASTPAGRSTRPYSTQASNTQRDADRHRRLHHRLLVDPHRPQLHGDDPPHARAGHDLVPAAAARVGALRHQPGADPRHAGDRDHGAHAGARARLRLRHLRPARSAATRCSSSTCSGSTRTRRSTS